MYTLGHPNIPRDAIEPQLAQSVVDTKIICCCMRLIWGKRLYEVVYAVARKSRWQLVELSTGLKEENISNDPGKVRRDRGVESSYSTTTVAGCV
jgi:hypothetical protein